MESTCDRKRKHAPQASSRLEQGGEQESKSAEMASRPSEIDPEFICAVCHDVLLDPAVARCGHDLCRHCWIRWLQYKRECPCCRTPLLPPLIPSTCFRLKTLVERLHPEAVAARREELGPRIKQIEAILAAQAQQQQQQMAAMFPPRFPLPAGGPQPSSQQQPTPAAPAPARALVLAPAIGAGVSIQSQNNQLIVHPLQPQGSQIARIRGPDPSSSTNSQPQNNLDTTLSMVVSSVQQVQQMNDTMDATLGAIDRMLRGINDIQQNLEEVQGLLPMWGAGPPLEELAFTIGADSEGAAEGGNGGNRRRRRRRGGGGSGGSRHTATNSNQQ